MPRDVVRVAAATVQVGFGLLAVLACGVAAAYLADPSGADSGQGLSFGVVLLLGGPLFLVWLGARAQLRWLLVLGAAVAVLAALMTAVTARQVWAIHEDPQLGLWTGAWTSALDAGLWLVVLAATIVELRLPPRESDTRSPGWAHVAAVGAPLALAVVVALLAGSHGASWMVRFNSGTLERHPAAKERAAELSGRVQWQRDLPAGDGTVATRSGLAVPVPGDRSDGAGVLMLDPSTGATRWRYRLRGVDDAPQVSPTAGGAAVVVSFEETDLPDDVPHTTFTLSADTGEVEAFWPDSGEMRGTDPPVLFDHVARDTNSVVAIAASGDELWTYKPERCADPRGVSSTPSVMIVRARQCGGDGRLQILGLDARSGDRRWTQPADSHDDESGPDAVVTDAGHQVELTDDHLQRRRLDTGAVTWTATVPDTCFQSRYLAGGAATVFLGRCADPTVDGPTALTAYAAASGRQLWSRRGLQPITSLVAVGDRGVLALVEGEEECDVQLLEAERTRTLLTVPDASLSQSPGLRCSSSSVLRVGDSYLLQIRLPADGTSSSLRYRFVALS